MIPLFIYLIIALYCQVLKAQESKILPQTEVIMPHKKIGFGAVGGGTSHYFWVLEILQELHNRGHNTTLYTRTDSIKYASDYPQVETQSVGGDLSFLASAPKEILKQFQKNMQHEKKDPLSYLYMIIPAHLANYTQEYKEYMDVIKKDKVDLMICDMFAVACIDATSSSHIPLVVTSTLTYTADSLTNYVSKRFPAIEEPTTETMTIWQRLQYLFYTFYIPYKLHRLDLPTHAFQRQHGIALTDNFFHTHRNAYKLINNMFGLEPARPMGALVQFVGPIMRQSYSPLTADLAAFLDSHARVAYVAFGQHATPTDLDTAFLVKALTTNLDQGHIDAVVWAAAKTHPVPSFNTKNVFMIEWAPQFAILSHPSIALFVTHGGACSVHESLFNKVPLYVFPFFGDQPMTARLVRQQRLGDFIDTADMVYTDQTLHTLTNGIRYVATDPDVHRTVQRVGAGVQLRSRRAVQRGADTVEELVVMAMDGTFPTLEDVGDRLGWMKRYDLDLLAIIGLGCFGIGWIGINAIQSVKLTRKIKTL